jgi:hypothetical protein
MARLLGGCGHLPDSVAHGVSLLKFIANQDAARGNGDLSLDVTDRRHDFRARPSLLCESLMSGDSAHQRAEQSRPLRLGSWFRVMLAAVGLVNLT